LANLSMFDMARQIHYLIDKGMSSSEALQRVENTNLEKSPRGLDDIRALFRPGQTKDVRAVEFYYRDTLKKLMDAADSQGGDRAKMFSGFHNSFVRNKSDFDLSIFDVSGLLFYLISVVAVATMCVTVYSIFVLPEFESLFFDFGQKLPPFTAIILTITGQYSAIVIGLVVLFILTIFLTVLHVKNTLKRLKYFSPMVLRLPIIGLIAKEFNQFLQLSFIRLMIYSGVESRKSVDDICNRFGDALELNRGHGALVSGGNLVLQMALELDTFVEEIDHQLTQIKLQGVNDFTKVKSIISVVSIIIVALVVGSVIIAMYLPIFQMGKIIG